jgi:hypothetical protein
VIKLSLINISPRRTDIRSTPDWVEPSAHLSKWGS